MNFTHRMYGYRIILKGQSQWQRGLRRKSGRAMAQAVSRRPLKAEARFDPGSIHVGFVVDKVALGQVFSPSTSVFPCRFHSTGAPLHGKTKKPIIFITGLHNKHLLRGPSPKKKA